MATVFGFLRVFLILSEIPLTIVVFTIQKLFHIHKRIVTYTFSFAVDFRFGNRLGLQFKTPPIRCAIVRLYAKF